MTVDCVFYEKCQKTGNQWYSIELLWIKTDKKSTDLFAISKPVSACLHVSGLHEAQHTEAK